MRNLRNVLKLELAKLGIDQEALAAPLGLTQQAISDWAAKGRIPIKHWDYIRERLGIEPSEFTGKQQRVHHSLDVTSSHHSAPGQIINGPRLNAMEQDLIDTMRKANLSDWAKISVILEGIKTRG